MLDYTNEPEYNYNYADAINKYVEDQVLRRTESIQENYKALQEKYDKFYDVCNNLYQANALADYSS